MKLVHLDEFRPFLCFGLFRLLFFHIISVRYKLRTNKPTRESPMAPRASYMSVIHNHVDIETELTVIADCAPPGEEARGGEKINIIKNT